MTLEKWKTDGGAIHWRLLNIRGEPIAHGGPLGSDEDFELDIGRFARRKGAVVFLAAEPPREESNDEQDKAPKRSKLDGVLRKRVKRGILTIKLGAKRPLRISGSK